MVEDLGLASSNLRLLSFAVALVTTIASGTVSGQSPKDPELAWPHGFGANASGLPGWVEHVLESPGLRIRVRIPQTWTLQPRTSSEALIAIDVKSGYRIEIVETQPTKFIYDQPLSDARLKATIEAMQAAVPKGYVVEKAGQVRADRQLWLWYESRIPAFNQPISESFGELLRSRQFGSALTWSFTTTVEAQLVRVYCAVLYPRNASGSELEARTRDAGALFRAVVERMTFGAQ